jgi:hypothetical protein
VHAAVTEPQMLMMHTYVCVYLLPSCLMECMLPFQVIKTLAAATHGQIRRVQYTRLEGGGGKAKNRPFSVSKQQQIILGRFS